MDDNEILIRVWKESVKTVTSILEWEFGSNFWKVRNLTNRNNQSCSSDSLLWVSFDHCSNNPFLDVGQKVERSKGKIVQIAEWIKGRKNKKSKVRKFK